MTGQDNTGECVSSSAGIPTDKRDLHTKQTLRCSHTTNIPNMYVQL